MGSAIKFSLEPKADANGVEVPTLIKKVDGLPDEDWCSVQDLDRLFNACVQRWGSNWDLEKVMTAVRETEIY